MVATDLLHESASLAKVAPPIRGVESQVAQGSRTGGCWQVMGFVWSRPLLRVQTREVQYSKSGTICGTASPERLIRS